MVIVKGKDRASLSSRYKITFESADKQILIERKLASVMPEFVSMHSGKLKTTAVVVDHFKHTLIGLLSEKKKENFDARLEYILLDGVA